MAFTHTTGTSAVAWRPDIFAFAPETVLAPALIFSATTVSGRIEGDAPSLRVAYADDVEAEFYDEGQTFDESEPDLAEALVYTKKFGELVRMTREQYRQAGTDQHLAQSVARSMIRKADHALLAQPAPVSPDVAPSTGLTNTAGLVTGLLGADLDVLVDLEAAVRANRGIPAAWVLSPDMWAKLRKLKVLSSGSNQSLLGAGVENVEPMLLSIPIAAVNAEMPAGTGLLVDPTAIVSAVSDLTIETDPSIYFTSQSIAIMGSMRTGHTVVKPGRIGLFAIPKQWTVTLGSPSAGTWVLKFGGSPTATITYNAPTAAAVKTALAGLNDAWTASDWTVTGSNGGPFTVTSPGGVLTGDGTGLTGGTFSVVAA